MNQGIRFSGHTMGTPGRDIFEVIRLFKTIVYDGIEVRVAKDGQIDSEAITDEEAASIYRTAGDEGMEFSCLTSYYQDFVTDKRQYTPQFFRNKSIVQNIILRIRPCPESRSRGRKQSRKEKDQTA